MDLVFDIPCDYTTVQAAVAVAIRDLRWSHIYRYDDLIPGWCEWDILDPKTVIRLRKMGKGVRLSIPPEIANILVPMLRTAGVPIRREQLLSLGKSEKGSPASRRKQHGIQGSTLDRVREARSLVKEGMPKTTACRRVGLDTRTYDRYVDLFMDLDESDWFGSH